MTMWIVVDGLGQYSLAGIIWNRLLKRAHGIVSEEDCMANLLAELRRVGRSTVVAAEPVMTVEVIRAICARELDCPEEYPFFHFSYMLGEEPDAALLRIFADERACHGPEVTNEDVVLVLCHG